jgi:type IV pilus assembly protein PilB
MYIEEDKLKDFIVDSGLVSRVDIDDAIKNAKDRGMSFGDYLVSEGKIAEDDLKKVQAYILGIPFIDIGDQKIPVEILSLIPEPIARKNNIIAYQKTENVLEVAMLDTDDLASIDFIRKKTGLKIQPRLTSTDSLRKALVQYQKSLKADFGDIIKKETESLDLKGEEDLNKMAVDLPVIKIVDTLLKHAILQSASDIHIEPLEKELIIRYRVDGLLHDAMTLPKNTASAIIARIKVLANLKLDEKRLPQDGRFKSELDGEKVSFRVSVLPVYYGEKIVMRILREGGGGFSLESLGFHGDGLERIHKALNQTVGMILTTGPTGSGKTTTLYTLMDILNKPDVNISTIEDPIEYQMKRINQTQVKPDIGFTFSDGLRSLVRQDPDIIMVGEIRDKETAQLAIQAALTGHLVFSTIYTNTALGVIPRLIDMGVDPYLIAPTLALVMGQRLVSKISPDGGKEIPIDGSIKVMLEKQFEDLPDQYKQDILGISANFIGVQPSAKYPRGTSGRMAVFEMFEMSKELENTILTDPNEPSLRKVVRAQGMLTMKEDAILKAMEKKVPFEEINTL